MSFVYDLPKSLIVHRASLIREDGMASALCSPQRAINLRIASWTARDSAVTCPRCLAIIDAAAAERGSEP